MKELNKEQVIEILRKQCEFVGADFEKIFKHFIEDKKMPKNWYLKYEWDIETENKFKDWLMKYLLKKRISIIKIMAKKHADMWAFCYGWKIKE